MSEQNQQKKLTAAQRIEQLEQALVKVFYTVNQMASDLMRQRGDIQMLDNKLSSTIGLVNGNLPLTSENLAAAMTKNNVDALARVVKEYVDKGVFVPQTEVPTKISDGFVVLKETTHDGKVITPRRQMLLTEMDLSIAEKFMGQKLGTVVELGEGDTKNLIEILEAYEIKAPTQDAPAEANA